MGRFSVVRVSCISSMWTELTFGSTTSSSSTCDPLRLVARPLNAHPVRDLTRQNSECKCNAPRCAACSDWCSGRPGKTGGHRVSGGPFRGSCACRSRSKVVYQQLELLTSEVQLCRRKLVVANAQK